MVLYLIAFPINSFFLYQSSFESSKLQSPAFASKLKPGFEIENKTNKKPNKLQTVSFFTTESPKAK